MTLPNTVFDEKSCHLDATGGSLRFCPRALDPLGSEKSVESVVKVSSPG